ncbi:MAG: two-component system OmpR family response regulator [Methylophilaceae bacterium]|jgi:two-component system OmpR family response regulator
MYAIAMRILIIEDDQEVSAFIAKGMREARHSTVAAHNGKDGLLLASTEAYDVLIIDRMLPQLDGLSIIKTLRALYKSMPILILSALGDVDDRVNGLKSGGDDYLVKPFAFSELLARVEILGRRQHKEAEQTTISAQNIEVNLMTRKVTRAGISIDLQTREFSLLEYLLKHKNQVVTRTMLLENVWDYHFDPQTNVIDVHISRLRSKIDKGFNTPIIQTVRGAGYIIEDND